MKIKTIQDENFQDYKKPAMLIATALCDWKCCKEAGQPISMCQNSEIVRMKTAEVSVESVYQRYVHNSVAKSVIFGGLEPMLQSEELVELVEYFRSRDIEDDFVIYTGYYPEEIEKEISLFKRYKNIIFKFGRYIPNTKAKYDDVLVVVLASENQYGVKIS